MSNIWVISDTHFGHENIIKYAGRPFNSAAHMDAELIANWNALVRPNDHIYHLGDVSMSRKGSEQAAFIKLIKSLKGHKRLLLGNHDHFPAKVYLDAGFEKIVGTGRWIDDLLFSHYPVHPGSLGRNIANVHGHIHEQDSPASAVFEGYETVWNEDSSHLKGQVQPYINVCVEKTNYFPIAIEDIKKEVRRQREV